MKPFAFHPELFELRNQVLEQLAASGFAWLSDFSSVDLLHDVHGLEVCGIRHESDAKAIRQLLCKLFPCWQYTRTCYKDATTREPGWKVAIMRDPEERDDKWMVRGG